MTNGPATATIMVLASILLRFAGLPGTENMRSIYVESWARVRKLSLSGRLLLATGACERMMVQWEALANKSGAGWIRTEYRGALVG